MGWVLVSTAFTPLGYSWGKMEDGVGRRQEAPHSPATGWGNDFTRSRLFLIYRMELIKPACPKGEQQLG